MVIIRAVKPAVIEMIEPQLLGDYHISKENLIETLRLMLGNQPDDILVLTAYDGDTLKAFIIAVSDSTSDQVALIQAWSEAPIKTWKSMFLRLCLWAEAKGKQYIHAETTRGMDQFLTEFGFKEVSRVMAFQVTEETHEGVVDDLIARNKGENHIPNLGRGLEPNDEPKVQA